MPSSRPRKRSSKSSAATELTLSRARQLRASMSPPERKLWVRIRNRQLRGLRFRRQHPVSPYVLDFYCHEARLAVELDGAHHANSRDHDAARDALLRTHNIQVLRIPVPAFERNIPAALTLIAETALQRIAELNALSEIAIG